MRAGTAISGPARRSPTRPRRFTRAAVQAIDESKILGVRAGRSASHRFIGIWAVVVDGRVFARSWTVRPDGWYRTFLRDPAGAIEVGGKQIRVRARRVRGVRILAAIERAYAAKYATPGALRYVRGFRTARRRAATTEFVPR